MRDTACSVLTLNICANFIIVKLLNSIKRGAIHKSSDLTGNYSRIVRTFFRECCIIRFDMDFSQKRACFVILFGLLAECRAQVIKNSSAIQTKSASSSGWGLLEISPNAFMSIIYKNNFRISVYRNQAVDPALVQYFYSPALIIDPSSAVSSFNRFTERFEMTFSVLMWDEEFESFVCSEISKKLGAPVATSSVRTLPIEEIRIDAIGHADKYDIVNKWTSYASQPSTFTFRLNCLKNDTCSEAAQNMQKNPQNFVAEMVVYYSLRSQKSARRVIQVKAEHVQNGALYTTLNQRFPDHDVVYMKSDDLKQLTLEIASNVVATEVTDDEFVSQDQSITIGTLLENVLKAKTVSTVTFESQMWSSVFWHDENARPDKITQSLNDVYNKSDSKLKDIIKNYMSSESSGSGSGAVGGNVNILGIIDIGGSASGSGSTSSQSISNEEKEKLVELLTEAKHVSQWNGEKFVPKAMQLSRINLSGLRTTSIITSTQVRVTKTTSELSSRINILPSASNAGELVQQRAEVFRLERRIQSLEVQTGRIITTGTTAMTFSHNVPTGWLPCNGMSLDCSGIHQRLCEVTNSTATPNFQGRFPVGFNSSFAEHLGAVGGEEQHTLTVAEMPSHQHDYGHMVVYPDYGGGKHYEAGKHRFENNVGATSGAAGGGLPHNNLPPYFAVQFIIKI
ncbi:uncharacterized protein LOC129599933 [Paramacrobiotus metropolitanus]|uniref:uncharacterized protein LOC129599933 n=1 Tax=Paramacrobiotus metropolitanus TaxID=2943436 RepID=UPI0024462235|nr:uncharacterized protein LOC129599933 [Paramacrobiotus metropolitanus]